MSGNHTILFCHCTYAQVVPEDVKTDVLRRLCDSGRDFESVADLCEMSARRDPALKRLSSGGPLKVAACYPRAVKWLFAAAHAPLDKDAVEIRNQRLESADEIVASLMNDELKPNLPDDQTSGTQSASSAGRSH